MLASLSTMKKMWITQGVYNENGPSVFERRLPRGTFDDECGGPDDAGSSEMVKSIRESSECRHTTRLRELYATKTFQQPAALLGAMPTDAGSATDAECGFSVGARVCVVGTICHMLRGVVVGSVGLSGDAWVRVRLDAGVAGIRRFRPSDLRRWMPNVPRELLTLKLAYLGLPQRSRTHWALPCVVPFCCGDRVMVTQRIRAADSEIYNDGDPATNYRCMEFGDGYKPEFCLPPTILEPGMAGQIKRIHDGVVSVDFGDVGDGRWKTVGFGDLHKLERAESHTLLQIQLRFRKQSEHPLLTTKEGAWVLQINWC